MNPNSNVRTFRAADARSALSAVRAALGGEAVILETREVAAGLFGRAQIEVTAAGPGPSAPDTRRAAFESAPGGRGTRGPARAGRRPGGRGRRAPAPGGGDAPSPTRRRPVERRSVRWRSRSRAGSRRGRCGDGVHARGIAGVQAPAPARNGRVPGARPDRAGAPAGSGRGGGGDQRRGEDGDAQAAGARARALAGRGPADAGAHRSDRRGKDHGYRQDRGPRAAGDAIQGGVDYGRYVPGGSE